MSFKFWLYFRVSSFCAFSVDSCQVHLIEGSKMEGVRAGREKAQVKDQECKSDCSKDWHNLCVILICETNCEATLWENTIVSKSSKGIVSV